MGEAEHARPVPEEAAALCGQCGATHQFTSHGIVHTLDHQCRDPALPACCQRLAVIGSEWCPRHHGQRRKMLPDIEDESNVGRGGSERITASRAGWWRGARAFRGLGIERCAPRHEASSAAGRHSPARAQARR
jgi:hypothetical protein